MKKIGATYQSIANALGYRNRSSAADALTRALRDTVSKETANEIRLIELERLDSMRRRGRLNAVGCVTIQ